VPKTASAKEIKQAFRKMARKYHPESIRATSLSESRFKEINEAYEVVGDADKRKKYDDWARTGRCTSRRSAPAAVGGRIRSVPMGLNFGGGGAGGGARRAITDGHSG
jgi:DnaJ-class molecular chaperone